MRKRGAANNCAGKRLARSREQCDQERLINNRERGSAVILSKGDVSSESDEIELITHSRGRGMFVK